MQRRIVRYHHWKFQLFGAINGNRGTNESAGMRFEKIDFFGSNALGSQNQIAFVFAIFVIDDNHEISLFYFLLIASSIVLS